MDLFERVSEDIKNAMKAKDKVALETLRNVKKFLFYFLPCNSEKRYKITNKSETELYVVKWNKIWYRGTLWRN